MSSIRNTTSDMDNPMYAALFLGDAARRGGTAAIEAMEHAGQQQLVHSDRLPVNTFGTDEDFTALGFVFGVPDANDPLFRAATLPAGWSKQGSDHDMWSHIVDEHGRRRVSVFYKAAFYDRDAFMRLVDVDGGESRA